MTFKESLFFWLVFFHAVEALFINARFFIREIKKISSKNVIGEKEKRKCH